MPDVFSQKNLLTRGDKAVVYAHEQIQLLTKDVMTDDLLLLEIMAGGRRSWRNEFLRQFKGLPVDDECAELLWRLFAQQFKQKFGTAKPSTIIDSLHVPSPITDREIEDSWEHFSSSSDDARRYFGVK